MLSSLFFLSLVLAASVKATNKKRNLKRYAPIVCDHTLECEGEVLEEKAFCFGSASCKNALIKTRVPVRCTGTDACVGATIHSPSQKIICGGLRSCEYAKGRKGPIKSQDVILCNGFQACSGIAVLQGATIRCDGDLSCSNYHPEKGKPEPISISSVKNTTCSGKAVCKDAILASRGKETLIECDGAAACKDSTISAPEVQCQGKISCNGATISTQKLTATGFLGAAKSTVTPMRPNLIDAMVIDALGHNSMVSSNIDASHGRVEINALGYRALIKAKIDCRFALCQITCMDVACKDATILINDQTTLMLYPKGCMPEEENEKPNRSKGVVCPKVQYEDDVVVPPQDELEIMNELKKLQLELDSDLLEIATDLAEIDMDFQSQLSVHNGPVSLHSSRVSKLAISNSITAAATLFLCSVAYWNYARVASKAKHSELQPLLN